ncbi:MAG: CoA transferase [Ilumatobacteraceae bacterium]|mgnify:FL=1|jgi:crotonobetainyl-CoA:carnitine CoA-transferase CaiB-like acyl-CoA transferase|nr:CoA transferase [Ilumatobacteraceae bacterium]MDP4706393.1 CoA transferase [Ilumatobacteraceae bacterium]MDP4713276.1 CoA transferase [Ilumatobacteraceae bacterium]MDP5115284.1 CoA transferase [Ilumatobacteraceae bacterium]
MTKTAQTAQHGPLRGIKVLDLSVMISGPLAAMMLGDQGADVIKVESPGLGDFMRYLGSAKGGMTGIFVNNNRGKRSLVVDLKSEQGVAVLKKLAETADVVIQNFRPGAVERLGIGYEDLKKVNPQLIYVSISGYGPDGPDSGHRVYDNVIQAASGLASVQTDPRNGEPSLFRTLLCDKVTSLTAAQAISSALYARAAGNAEGQHIVLAMLDAAVSFMWPDSGMDAVLLDDDANRTPTIGQNYGITRLKDGFAAIAVVSDSEFRGLCHAYGRPELADDERFASMAGRTLNASELVPLMTELSAQQSAQDFVQRAQSFDVPAASVVALADLPHQPQIMNNKVFLEREHPVAGRIREPRPAARFSSTPAQAGGLAPTAGQHSDEIVTEVGLDAAALRTAGVIF